MRDAGKGKMNIRMSPLPNSCEGNRETPPLSVPVLQTACLGGLFCF